MKNNAQRLLWWVAWLLLPTATLIARVERETGKSLGSNWFYIATLVAFAGYMVLDVVNGLK